MSKWRALGQKNQITTLEKKKNVRLLNEMLHCSETYSTASRRNFCVGGSATGQGRALNAAAVAPARVRSLDWIDAVGRPKSVNGRGHVRARRKEGLNHCAVCQDNVLLRDCTIALVERGGLKLDQ